MLRLPLEEQPARLQTPGYDCFSLGFDRNARRLACASGTNFGMKGPGRLWVFGQSSSNGTWGPLIHLDANDAMFDVSWVESSPETLSSHVLAALADGSVQLYRIPQGPAASNASSTLPTFRWMLHSKETCSVHVCPLQADKFLSTSYDGTVKVVRLNGAGDLQTLVGHQGIVYQGRWSPREASALVSVGADHTVRLWDDRRPLRAVTSLPAHENEVLAVDWNDSNPLQFATGSTDCTVKVWDWRSVRSGPLQVLRGHHRAVRGVRWPAASDRTNFDTPSMSSYGHPSQLYTVGYDMALRVWRVEGAMSPFVGSWEGHTEFVTGIDVSLVDGLVATCAWDQSICLLRPIHWGQAF